MSLHRPFIGGSDVSAIAGINPYKRPIDVWARLTGRQPDVEQNLAMRIGQLAEPMLTTLYEERTGDKLAPAEIVLHPQYPHIGGSPDRLMVGRPKSVELKTGNLFTADRWGEEGTDEVPEEYLCQVAWYQMLLGHDEADVAVLLGGADFRVYRLHRDRTLEERLLDLALQFHRDYVVTDREPPPDGSESMRDYIATRYGDSGPDLAPSSPEADAIAADYSRARQIREQWEQREETAKQRLQQLIGSARGIHTAAGKVSWSTCKGKTSVDIKALSETYPELVARHTRIGAKYRRFVFKAATP